MPEPRRDDRPRGGSFTPEDYASAYRRFATLAGTFGGTRPMLIACAAHGGDVDWTRRFLQKVCVDRGGGPRPQGLAMHYYCGTAGTDIKFSVDQWYELLWRAASMEELQARQRAAMDEFDPERKIPLVVDEWGTWHPSLPAEGRPMNWQQNTVRDALVAALTLDTFNRRADHVLMANIAQTVNVLQSLVLTDGPRMVLTPTYYVYRMYADHQGSQSVPVRVEAEDISFEGEGAQRKIFSLTASASLREKTLTLTMTNLHASEALSVEIRLEGGARVREARGEVLTHGNVHAYNEFGDTEAVAPRGAEVQASRAEFTVSVAAASLTKLTLSLS